MYWLIGLDLIFHHKIVWLGRSEMFFNFYSVYQVERKNNCDIKFVVVKPTYKCLLQSQSLLREFHQKEIPEAVELI